MKHSIRELYKNGKNIYNYPVVGATKLLYRQNNGKTFSINCADGSIITAYPFGEKTWFDTEAELLGAKADYQEQRKLNKIRAEAMAKIEALSLAELLELTKDL